MKKRWMLLTVALCLLQGCGAKDAPAAVPAAAPAPVEETQAAMVGQWEADAEEITVEDPDLAQLRQQLPRFSGLRTVTFTGEIPEDAAAFSEEFPEVTFQWTVELNGEPVTREDIRLELEPGTMAAEVEAVLRRMPQIAYVDAMQSGLSQQELRELSAAFPDTDILWNVEFFGQTLPSDTEEIDISGVTIADVAEVEALADCFYQLKKVVMCGCGVEDEVMDALNRRHEDVQYVWEVKICWRKLRTDITWFFPFRLSVEPFGDDLYNLRYCTEVEVVDIGHAQVKDIEWAAYMPHLKYMLFGDTAIKDITPLADHKELIYLEMFKTQVKDYTPLLSCTALEDLNLGYTYGDPAIIAQMTWLKNVWWHRPTPPWGGPESDIRLNLGKTLPNATVDVSYTAGSTDGGWRELPNYYAQRDLLGMFYMDG